MGERKIRYQTRPPKYDEGYHTPLLLKMLSKGESRAMYCAEAKIAVRTFYDWLDMHPEFSDAYEVGTQMSQAYWERLAAKNIGVPNFNYSIWAAVMRDRFNHSEYRKLKFKGIDIVKTAAERFGIVLTEISKGNLTGQEAVQISNVIANGVKIDENTELRKEVEEIKERLEKG